MNVHSIYPYKNNISFSSLKKVKFTNDFDVKNNSNDSKVYNSVFLSDAFNFLIENRDVSLEFDRYTSKLDGITYTVLRYMFEPIVDKNISLFKKIKRACSNFIDGNESLKKRWMFGYIDNATGENVSLADKISDFSVDDMKQIINA